MVSKFFQYLIFTLMIFFICFIGTSLYLIMYSFVINGWYISLGEIKEIIIFCFKGFLLIAPLLTLGAILDKKIRK